MSKGSLIKMLLQAVSGRIRQAAHNELEDYGERGIVRSSIAVTGTFNALAIEMKSELTKLLDDLALTRLNRRKLNELKEEIHCFIIKEFEDHKRYLQQINVLSSGQLNFEDFIQKTTDGVTSSIELKMLIMDKVIVEKRIKVIWDIGKILITAAIGGFIGAYIKNFLGAP
ncbi:hypothetical protein QJ48_04150 [Paenibacillus sp. A3]|uniref:hypothetical protein n=1 Tax=Paenibacillus sp. A3 TaxID=1337054 RepID=UPI0006D5363F|nr:hypothetical protein [Paenibacillus sp. A3]KPV60726.1 hypothetical protein QJ48_04150 [Paenibacillus sp. A3]